MKIIVESESPVRVDKYITTQIPDYSRTYVSQLIEADLVTVNGVVVRAKQKVKSNDIIEFEEPEAKDLEIKPENLNLDIVYEDEDILVVNKPSGMVVHPANGHYEGTLVNGLLFQAKSLSSINGVIRPGIVHRIDKETSGLLVVAKNDLAHESLSDQLKNKTVERQYVALVYGNFNYTKGRVDAPIGRDDNDRQKMAVTAKNSKSAITYFTVLEQFKDMSLIECRLETGRTHQIRVHMAYIKHPIFGDPKYSFRQTPTEHGQYLHAKTLGFHHPRTNEWMSFDSPLPEYFEAYLEQLRNEMIS